MDITSGKVEQSNKNWQNEGFLLQVSFKRRVAAAGNSIIFKEYCSVKEFSSRLTADKPGQSCRKWGTSSYV